MIATWLILVHSVGLGLIFLSCGVTSLIVTIIYFIESARDSILQALQPAPSETTDADA